MTYPRFPSKKKKEKKKKRTITSLFLRKLRRTHRSYFRNSICYILSIFALAEIIQNIKVYICLNREFCQLFKKKKSLA